MLSMTNLHHYETPDVDANLVGGLVMPSRGWDFRPALLKLAIQERFYFFPRKPVRLSNANRRDWKLVLPGESVEVGTRHLQDSRKFSNTHR
jgi:hypothetical protein